MAMLETRLNVPLMLLDNLSEQLLNVPTLLTIDLWMEMSEASLIVPALLAIKFCMDGNVSSTSIRPAIVSHPRLNDIVGNAC